MESGAFRRAEVAVANPAKAYAETLQYDSGIDHPDLQRVKSGLLEARMNERSRDTKDAKDDQVANLAEVSEWVFSMGTSVVLVDKKVTLESTGELPKQSSANRNMNLFKWTYRGLYFH